MNRALHLGEQRQEQERDAAHTVVGGVDGQWVGKRPNSDLLLGQFVNEIEHLAQLPAESVQGVDDHGVAGAGEDQKPIQPVAVDSGAGLFVSDCWEVDTRAYPSPSPPWGWSSTVGDLKADEGALLRALEILETSRSAWLAEMEAFATRRRAEKKQHRRSPTASDRLRLYSYRWPGPDGHQATLNAVEHLWAQHRAAPFPQTPAAFKGDLVYLDSTITGCISTYVSHGGRAAVGHREILLACIAPLGAQLRHLGYPADRERVWRR